MDKVLQENEKLRKEKDQLAKNVSDLELQVNKLTVKQEELQRVSQAEKEEIIKRSQKEKDEMTKKYQSHKEKLVAKHETETAQMKKKIEELQRSNLLPPIKYSLSGVEWKAITKIEDFKPAQHMCYYETYWHHAIVDSVNQSSNTVSVIVWALAPTWEIIKKDLELQLGRGPQMEVAEYTQGCYPDALVLKRARARIGEKDYGVITNFARAFPEWCKTGRGRLTHNDTEADNRYLLAIQAEET